MIITTVLQVLVERLELGKSLPQAIAAPRASQRNSPATATTPAGATIPEPAFEQTGLKARGHLFGAAQGEIGAVTGIEFLGRDRFLAAAEPIRRGGGSAAVVRKGR
jgi:gamma-glutamyltranspeptidase/glutathione hydrolase